MHRTILSRRFTRLMLMSACTAPLVLASAGRAETLRDALVRAYNSNPTLQAARSGQRANDENVPLQKSQGRPNLGGTGDYTEVLERPANAFNAPARSTSAALSLSVPIYQGGGVKNGVRAAETRVAAGQDSLRGTEMSVFSNVVAAYMDVIRDTAIVGFNEQNVHVLEVNLQATNDRFEVGDLTRTDVAQSQSRLAIARSDLEAARSNLIASKERYIQQVGSPPDALETPPALPGLPANPEEAVSLALADNPDILAAQKEVEATGYDVRVAQATRLPTLSAFTRGSYTNYLGTLGSSIPGVSIAQTQRQASAGVSLTLPLYQGGAPSARVRQAQARQSQAMENEVGTERGVIAQARSAYASWQASQEVIRSSQAAVDAATLSLEGVRAENSVGSRTILDILDAERELLNAKVTLVSARRNAYVAGFTLLAAMGRAEAADLGLDGGPLYDPMTNYKRVRSDWWDWDTDPKPTPVATRTVDTPAQNANVPPPSE